MRGRGSSRAFSCVAEFSGHEPWYWLPRDPDQTPSLVSGFVRVVITFKEIRAKWEVSVEYPQFRDHRQTSCYIPTSEGPYHIITIIWQLSCIFISAWSSRKRAIHVHSKGTFQWDADSWAVQFGIYYHKAWIEFIYCWSTCEVSFVPVYLKNRFIFDSDEKFRYERFVGAKMDTQLLLQYVSIFHGFFLIRQDPFAWMPLRRVLPWSCCDPTSWRGWAGISKSSKRKSIYQKFQFWEALHSRPRVCFPPFQTLELIRRFHRDASTIRRTICFKSMRFAR